MRKKPTLFLLCLMFAVIVTIFACDNKMLWFSQSDANSMIVQTSPLSLARKPVATKNVSHALGQVEIPLHPQRIVVLDGEGFLLDAILSLGIKPVGLTRCSDCINSDPFSEFIGDISSVGSEQPSLEKILTLKPDLILGYKWQESFYPLLSRIAPTVMIDIYSDGVDFKRDFKYLADILNSSDRAEEVLAKYNEKILKFQQKLGENLKTKTASLLSFWGSTVHAYGPELPVYAQVMSDAGIQFIPAYQKLKDGYLRLSLETVSEWDADFLFVQLHYKSDLENLESLLFFNHPIWSTLQAVQNNQVHIMNWSGSGGPIIAGQIIDDLYQYFTDVLLQDSENSLVNDILKEQSMERKIDRFEDVNEGRSTSSRLRRSDRPCAVAFSAPNKPTYLFTNLPADAIAAALLEFGDRYHNSKTGNVPWEQFPEALQSATLLKFQL